MTQCTAVVVFSAVEFLDATVRFFWQQPWLSIVILLGLAASCMAALVWVDTRDDDRSEMDDTPVHKVVQIRPEARTYTSEDYREFVKRHQHSEQSDEILARINARADDLARAGSEKLAQQRKERA